MSREHVGPRAAYLAFTGSQPSQEALDALGSLLESGVTYIEARDSVEALRELPVGSRSAAIALLRKLRRKLAPDVAVAVAEARSSQESSGVNDAPDGGTGSPSEVLLAWGAQGGHTPERRAAMVRLIRAVARKRFPSIALSRISSRVDQEPDA